MQTRRHIWILIATIVVLGVLFYFFSNIFIYIIVAEIVSLLGRPIYLFLNKLRIKNIRLGETISALVTLIALLALFALLFVVFIPLIAQQSRNIQQLDVNQLRGSLEQPLADLDEIAHTYNLLKPEETLSNYLQAKFLDFVSALRLDNIFTSIINAIGNLVVAIFSIGFIAFFFLKDGKLFTSMILAFTPRDRDTEVKHVILESRALLSRYFVGLLVETLLVGALVTLGLFLVGVKNPVAIGFFAGITNIIPYVGPLIGAALGSSLTLLDSLNANFYEYTFPLLLKVIAVFLIVQLIDNMILQPLIYSNSVKAHPLEVFLVISIAGTIGGIGGMILAIPIYTLLRVLAREFFNQFRAVQSITKNLE